MTLQTEILTHYNYLYRAALRWTYNRDAALDLVQETFYKALRYADRYREKNIKNWLFTILKNTFCNTVEYNRQPFRIKGEDGASVGSRTTPESILITKELYARASGYKELALLLNGYDYGEIAAAIGRPEGTVRQRIFKARRALALLK